MSYLICYIKFETFTFLGLIEFAASLRKGINRPKHVQSKKRYSWSQTLPLLAADSDRIVLPIPVQTTKTTLRMIALVINETAKA